MGSTQAEACPASAAYCPGHAADEEGDPPGSRPLLIESGAARRTRKVRGSTLTPNPNPSPYPYPYPYPYP